MKTPLFVLTLFAGGSLALAQSDNVIHATVVYDKRDGLRRATVTDPEKGTAEETVTDSSGKLKYKVTYLIDERNEPIGSITYDPKGAIMYRTGYKRDGMNRVDEESVSSAAGQLMRRRVYTYGNGNQVLNIMEYDGNGTLISDGRKKKPGSPPEIRRAQPVKR